MPPSKDISRINRLFRAFSDPTRLRVLHLLREGELCVGDLVSVLRVTQPNASRHLAYLRRAGLVRVRRRGRWSFYGLAPPSGKFHETLLTCLEDCFTDVPRLKGDSSRARRVKSSGGCCPP